LSKNKSLKEPDLSAEIVDLHKTLQIIYHKGYLAGLKEALETMKDTKDEKKTSV
jgi:hypothetical protein